MTAAASQTLDGRAMRAIGRLANAIVTGVLRVLGGLALLVGIVIAVPTFGWGFRKFWSLVDGAHPTSLRSVAGYAGLLFVGLLALAAIGEWLDPFDWRDLPVKGGSGDMRTADADDLKDGGIFGRR
jgi:hypothetical protein